MCTNLKYTLNKRYQPNRKNGGIPEHCPDPALMYVPIPCGKCEECMKGEKAEICQILTEEINHDRTGKFMTYTFSEDSLAKLAIEVKKRAPKIQGYDLENAIAQLGWDKFSDRWKNRFGHRPKHWKVTELGQKEGRTERIHWHGILWTTETKATVQEIWQYGHINNRYDKTWEAEGNYCGESTAYYLVKYVTKKDFKHMAYEPLRSGSKGLGYGYIAKGMRENKYNENGKTNDTYRTRKGTKVKLATKFKKKIYSDKERETLWLEKLKSDDVWIGGHKYSKARTSKETLEAALREAQKHSKQMGYEKQQLTMNERRLENDRRTKAMEMRIQRLEEKRNQGT